MAITISFNQIKLNQFLQLIESVLISGVPEDSPCSPVFFYIGLPVSSKSWRLQLQNWRIPVIVLTGGWGFSGGNAHTHSLHVGKE